jgi:hypothetical protein
VRVGSRETTRGYDGPLFDLTFMRVDRAKRPNHVEGFYRRVDWPFLPRERESVEGGGAEGGCQCESVDDRTLRGC